MYHNHGLEELIMLKWQYHPRQSTDSMLLVVVQLLSCVWLFVTPWTAAHQASLSFTILWSFLKLMSIEWVMQFNHLILCRPRLLLPSIFPNESFFLFQWVGFLHLVAKVLELWFDLLAVQGTLKSLLQHCNSKASILQHSAFFMVQLSHLYMVTGKSIALTIHTFVSKVVSLLFNTFIV